MEPTKVLITIDTEFSIGGHFKDKSLMPLGAERMIYCRIRGIDYGIGMIMDTLNRYALKGVFFLETESRFYFGDDLFKEIIEVIRSRGHEIQLHIHCGFRNFRKEAHKNISPDEISAYSLQEQSEIIFEGKKFLEKNGANQITAFRAGSFSANKNTIEACHKNNLKYLSNVNLATPNCKYLNAYTERLNPFRLESGLVEIPVTSMREFGGRKEWTPFQICSASSTELIQGCKFYRKNGAKLISILTHSFEFVKGTGVQRENIVPRRIIIHRFDALCRFLGNAKNEFETTHFSDLDERVLSSTPATYSYKSPVFDVARRYTENFFSDL